MKQQSNSVNLTGIVNAFLDMGLDRDVIKRNLETGTVLKSRNVGWATYLKLCKHFYVKPIEYPESKDEASRRINHQIRVFEGKIKALMREKKTLASE